MALGATRKQVMGLVLRQSLLLTAVGILIGVVSAATLTRYLESRPVRVSGPDRRYPVSFYCLDFRRGPVWSQRVLEGLFETGRGVDGTHPEGDVSRISKPVPHALRRVNRCPRTDRHLAVAERRHSAPTWMARLRGCTSPALHGTSRSPARSVSSSR